MGGNVEMVGIESLARHVPGRPDLADMGGSDAGLRQVLHGLPAVDQVGVQERVAALATRSIKKDAKLQALDLAVACLNGDKKPVFFSETELPPVKVLSSHNYVIDKSDLDQFQPQW